MTERTGGSDVSGTSTIAKKDGDSYRLYGTKWFTSATTSQMAMTLARIEGSSAGGAGLSLFYVELRDTDGNLRNIRVNRLKDKLGTRALPTAELTLEGTPAKLVGTPGEGVKKISSLFNITRIYNSCMSAAGMGRAIVLARDYSKKRFAFGKPLSEHPLHVETLAAMELEYEAAFLLTFRAVELLGKEETEGSTREESAILRLLTPIVKLYTAKQGIAVASEALECFGGAGYVEDTGLPSLLRDAQVLAIWEGTTNVLSLDMIRAIEKEKALEPYLADLGAKTSAIREPRLGECAKKVLAALETLRKAAAKLEPVRARAFAFTLARATCAALLLEHAERCAGTSEFEKYVDSALRWCEQDLTSTLTSRRLGL
jgi:alkylation response protein AidB-like acyl-CoA dehydrogenase